MILPDQVNLASIAFLQHQAEEELEIQARVVKARALLDGYYDTNLARETATSLVGGAAADIEGPNLSEITVRTIVRRVDIQGYTGNDEKLITWVENVCDAIGVDIMQGELHQWVERDGEAFAIVDYDRNATRPWDETTTGLPSLIIKERYTSAEISYGEEVGSNSGCKAHYRNNDPHQPLEMISDRWIETIYEDEEAVATQRMNLYIADQSLTRARIEKYIMNEEGEWEEFHDSYIDENGSEVQEEWPIWWTDNQTETGRSLPIIAVHFRNEEMQPITRKIWGLQNAMDHAWSSFLASMALAGHQILKFFGWTPTTDGKEPAEDGSNLMRIKARSLIGSPKKRPDEASLEAIEAGDIAQSINAMDKIAIYAAFVSGLPINNFIISKSVASSATLRQGEADMVAHINALHRLLGRSWSQVFELFRLMELLYGDTPFAPSAVRPIWAPPETVNVEARTEEARAQKDTGVPVEFIWRHVWGYTEKEVDAMQKALAALAAPTTGNDGTGTDAAPANGADSPTASTATNGRRATTAKSSE
ncbi:MAG: phage portal protein [Anaerolineae bacterium]|nr:phage portal protein [Anaerolineae bacterium]